MNHFPPTLNDGKTVFVFGSNLAGVHGAGAAKQALKFWGAKLGVGVGRQGMAYAIPTKDRNLASLPLDRVRDVVADFKVYAWKHPCLRFLVTDIGCGLAGFSVSAIAPMFRGAPKNCVLTDRFSDTIAALTTITNDNS